MSRKIFIVHGRDRNSLRALIRWLQARSVDTEAITLESLIQPGDSIPVALETIALLGDVAIVLATPDDLGRLKGERTSRPRARQNVWVELGWFWARLGRKRTLLILKGGDQELPSDLSGLLYLRFTDRISEISAQLAQFLQSLDTSEPDSVTEVVSVNTDPGKRTWEFNELVESARDLLVTTGIGMVNLRQQIHSRLSAIAAAPSLCYDLILLDKDFARANLVFLDRCYRPDLVQDIDNFERELSRSLKALPSVRARVRLYRYEGIMSFIATVADPPEWGSLMLVETILPVDGSAMVERPRLLLRRRCRGGLYDRFWKAIVSMKDSARQVIIV